MIRHQDLIDIGFHTGDPFDTYYLPKENMEMAVYDTNLQLLHIQRKKHRIGPYLTRHSLEIRTVDHLEEALEMFDFPIPIRIPITTR